MKSQVLCKGESYRFSCQFVSYRHIHTERRHLFFFILMTTNICSINSLCPVCASLLMNIINFLFRRQEKLHSLLFNLLENILKLPESILNSRMFSHTALEHKVGRIMDRKRSSGFRRILFFTVAINRLFQVRLSKC